MSRFWKVGSFACLAFFAVVGQGGATVLNTVDGTIGMTGNLDLLSSLGYIDLSSTNIPKGKISNTWAFTDTSLTTLMQFAISTPLLVDNLVVKFYDTKNAIPLAILGPINSPSGAGPTALIPIVAGDSYKWVVTGMAGRGGQYQVTAVDAVTTPLPGALLLFGSVLSFAGMGMRRRALTPYTPLASA
jgi:hypothetical protein